MFIPLVDQLRCPVQHEETWLVASIERAERRDIIEGTLGCPQCLAEYRVHDGVVEFDPTVAREAFIAPDELEATRLAAGLDLTESRMVAVLHGRWAAHAPLVRTLSPAQMILVNAPEGLVSGDGISMVTSAIAPLARNSVDAVAIDTSATPEMIATLLGALRGGQRMLGPVSLAIPAGLTELVRDDEVWVAQAETGVMTSAPIMPTRRVRTSNQ